jgi:hypothetical protein
MITQEMGRWDDYIELYDLYAELYRTAAQQNAELVMQKTRQELQILDYQLSQLGEA